MDILLEAPTTVALRLGVFSLEDKKKVKVSPVSLRITPTVVTETTNAESIFTKLLSSSEKMEPCVL